ncbi:hypothetical protein LOD99_5809 [Oopsacas minuta]|uniref:H15 domain-containing protein n=1 Tax=Oopsacas minuta TaxID=111878 RepID=A0AAV7JPY5_9METZ|nr:hypothetical protein LOD99_5809 [Oopsacas minuta]
MNTILRGDIAATIKYTQYNSNAPFNLATLLLQLSTNYKMSTKTPKAPKKATKSSHPPYNDMIVAALKAGSRKGLSKIGISKYIKENYSVNDGVHDSQTKQTLKRLLLSGKLVKVKGIGLAGSFKFSKNFMETEGKKNKTSSAKKTTKKPAITLTATTAKPKKPTTKKPSTAKKPSPKKPAAKPKKDTPKKKFAASKAPAKPKAKKPPVKKTKTPKKPATKKK